jgi:teichuronic acid exporter
MSTGISKVNRQETSVGSISNAPAPSRRGATRLVHAVAWTGAATWATQLITWGYMIVVARMLTPSDYGLIGMANVPLGFLIVASEFGVGNAVVMMPDLTAYQVSQLNTVAVLAGVMLFALSCFGAYPLGRFFRAPDLPMVVVALSLVLVITSFKTVPAALLQRDFRFKLLAKTQAAEAVGYGLAAVSGVMLGARYWSLVMASITGVTVSTLLVLARRRHAFAWPKLASLRQSLVFSGQILGRRVAWYCSSNADFTVAGRVLGKAALGSYNIAWNIAQQPQQKFTDLVTGVIPSYFSKAQNDHAALREYVLTITQALSLLTLPATLGLALVADDFMAVALGPKWMNAVAPLRILAVYTAVRSITSFLAPLLNVTGQSRFVMWNHIIAVFYLAAGFYVGSRWGVVGIALGWPLLYPFLAVPLYVRVFKAIDLSVQAYMDCLCPALTGSFIMIVGVLMLRALLPIRVIYLRLLIEIAAGAVSYVIPVAALYSGRVRRLYRVVWPATQKPAFAPGGG